MSQLQHEDNGNKVMRDVLNAMADTLQPKDADVVRKFAEEKYPTHAERLQHLSNLCDRHKRELLPRPTEHVCPDCMVEMENKREEMINGTT